MLEDVFMAFRYDVDVSSNETGTASYSADDFIALDETPDALNPDAPPEPLPLLRVLQRVRSRGTSVCGYWMRMWGITHRMPGAKIPFTAHKRITINPLIQRPMRRCTRYISVTRC